MTLLNMYLQDGASAQARAVLCMFQNFTIEESWSDKYKLYEAEPKVSRWENCREQGYVVRLRGKKHGHQLNIAFFQHRVSDQICAYKWEEETLNAPTVDSPGFQKTFEDYTPSKSVEYGQIMEMVKWIENELTTFWINNSKPEKI